MTYTPSKENTNSSQTINQLLLILGVIFFEKLVWLVLNKIIIPFFFTNDYGRVIFSKVDPLYKYYDWTANILLVIVLLIFAVIVKNKIVRTFLIIFLILEIVILLGFMVF